MSAHEVKFTKSCNDEFSHVMTKALKSAKEAYRRSTRKRRAVDPRNNNDGAPPRSRRRRRRNRTDNMDDDSTLSVLSDGEFSETASFINNGIGNGYFDNGGNVSPASRDDTLYGNYDDNAIDQDLILQQDIDDGLMNGGEDPGDGGQDPGDGGQDPGNGGQDPDDGGQDPGDGGDEPRIDQEINYDQSIDYGLGDRNNYNYDGQDKFDIDNTGGHRIGYDGGDDFGIGGNGYEYPDNRPLEMEHTHEEDTPEDVNTGEYEDQNEYLDNPMYNFIKGGEQC